MASNSQTSNLPTQVVVHPLVLLSTVDHYFRVAKDTKKRVVGILLGETYKGKIDVTNSYAVPFEEDPRDPNVWFFDHMYHENMFAMFKKVNAKEKVVGWYSTGPKIRPADIEINEFIRNYVANPVMVIIDANPTDEIGIPTEAYCSVENVSEETSENRRTFVNIPSAVGAFEAEEIGVEHLLRDIRDTTVTTLTRQVSAKLMALKQLKLKLDEMHAYLDRVVSGRMPPNPQIIYHMQDIFNLIPNLRVEELVRSFAIKTNDHMLTIYLSSLIRSIISLHNLINNKLQNRDEEKKRSEKKEEKTEKEKESKEKESKEAEDDTADKSARRGEERKERKEDREEKGRDKKSK
eukprot:TRINITY_DN1023_c0_g1_i1.p1 TRINITY_DN1023_c0_g1~~TRINITY_DN1023_c0_g1_i1.p1  ORF type:complete len:371 (-),score=144.56 TRINITY_DN1023_c0_g1_i1:200-1246(-)